MLALEWTVKNSTEDLFAFVVDGLHHLIRDGTYYQRHLVHLLILYR